MFYIVTNHNRALAFHHSENLCYTRIIALKIEFNISFKYTGILRRNWKHISHLTFCTTSIFEQPRFFLRKMAQANKIPFYTPI